MSSENPETTTRLLEVIGAWPKITDLAGFAIKAHGFGDSNGGFGVTYPGDLDEYEREVKGESIPTGMVQIYGYWGPPSGYEVLVSEVLYLTTLVRTLRKQGHSNEAALVETLLVPSA